MVRRAGTNSAGRNFDQSTINAVWNKAQIVLGYNANEIRKDLCGAWILKNEYGNTNSQFGWEIDHNNPVSNGGTDDLLNLQPLQWQNNRGKSDNYPDWSCSIKAI